MDVLPPLTAIGNVHCEIFGPEPDAARWDFALWDVDDWAEVDWQDVTPQSMSVEIAWGTDDAQGVLTVPAAGSWTIKTYDPDRILDPSNGESPFSSALKPGRPIRVLFADGVDTRVIRQGLIDEIEYDLVDATGTLSGTDDVQLMAAAKLRKGLDLDVTIPVTLRARASHLITMAGLQNQVQVEAAEYDPPVGPMEKNEASVWTHILNAAYDALYAAWLDRDGILKFRSFGNPIDDGLQIGGTDGIPIESVRVQASLQSVYTQVTAFDATDIADPPTPHTARDNVKATLFGTIELKRDQKVPNAAIWAQSVLDDRSGAALQYAPGTLYPQTKEQLFALIDLGMVNVVHLALEAVTPSVTVAPRVLGGKFMVDTSTGWTAELITYIPAKEWEENESLPPEPPPSKPGHKITVTYDCIKDVRAARTNTGANYGAGAEGENPIGAWQGWRNRCFFDFVDIPFQSLKVISVDVAEFLATTTTQVNVAFGSTPKVIIKRVTEAWSEGTEDNPAYNNATIYPGPSVTNTGSVTRSHNDAEGINIAWNILEIVRAWKNGSKQHGIGMFSAGEDSTKYTTEFWDRTRSSTSQRPRLRVTMTVEN